MITIHSITVNFILNNTSVKSFHIKEVSKPFELNDKIKIKDDFYIITDLLTEINNNSIVYNYNIKIKD